MIGIELTFRNKPKADGTFETFAIKECLVGNYGTPTTTSKKRIMIHLPKNTDKDVNGSWVDYLGESWHVIGTTVKQMDNNTPTRWDRYAIAETIATW